MDFLLLLAIFVLGFVTLFIGAISGGVGLITRPILLFLGIPVSIVIGSSRVAGLFGELPGIFILHQNKKIDWKLAAFLTIPNLIGSILAGLVVVSLLSETLNLFLGIVLLIAGIIFILNKNIGLAEHESSIPKTWRNIAAFFGTSVISFLGTITGGLGPLYSSLYIWIYGKSYIGASAIWRISSYLGTLGGIFIFVASGIVDWSIVASLGAGFMAGSYFGTQYGLKKGESWIRYLIIALAFGAAIKLIFF